MQTNEFKSAIHTSHAVTSSNNLTASFRLQFGHTYTTVETSHHKSYAVARGKERGFTHPLLLNSSKGIYISDSALLFHSLCVQPGNCICQTDSNLVVITLIPRLSLLRRVKVRVRVEPGGS